MPDYFEHSQEVRKQIEASSKLMTILRNHFTGKKSAEQMSGGQNNNIYRIGQLDSRLWLAMRRNILAGREGITSIEVLAGYETYANNAEYHLSHNERATQFCVGVAKIKERIRGPRGFSGFLGDVALLVEDFTEGGAREFEPSPADFLWINNPRELIYTDLDNVRQYITDFKYTAEQNMILL